MNDSATISVQEKYPIRYWITLAYMVGIPNFLHFDSTGRTHKLGLFNLTSISDIALTLIATFAIVVLTFLGRKKVLARKVEFGGGVWALLLLNMIVSSLLQPEARLTPVGGGDLALSLFRLGEWALALVLLLSLYSRASEEEGPPMIAQLLARTCWINIAMVWIVLPVAPSLVYQADGEGPASIPRLGGVMIHPGHIGLLAAVAFFHSLLLLQGVRRFAGCMVCLLTLALTYTRSTQIIFLIALWSYLIFFPPRRSLRWIGGLSLCVAAGAAAAFHNLVETYFSRGQQQSDVLSLDGRALTWQVSLEAAKKRPYVGYGYIDGPRNILRDMWHQTNWIPPHSHNEFIQAFLSGGVLSAILITWIYVYILWVACRTARFSVYRVFFLLVWIQLTITAIISTNVTTQFSRMGALLLPCFLVLYAERKQSEVRGLEPAKVYYSHREQEAGSFV